MEEEYIGVIKMFSGNFAPKNFMFCAGQLLPISPYQALFSIIGTTYGGNGTTNFALPNLQGVVPIGQGQDRFGNIYSLGQVAGSPTTSILTSNMPAHVHTGPGKISVSSAESTDSTPTENASIAVPGSIISRVFSATLGFATSTPSVNLLSNVTTAPAGSGIPINNMQPYLAINYVICIQGLYPSRN